MKKLALAFCFLLATAQLAGAENAQPLSYFARFTSYVTEFFSQPFFQNIRNFFVTKPDFAPPAPSKEKASNTSMASETTTQQTPAIPDLPPQQASATSAISPSLPAPIITQPTKYTAAIEPKHTKPTSVTEPSSLAKSGIQEQTLKKLPSTIEIPQAQPEITDNSKNEPIAPLFIKLKHNLEMITSHEPDVITSPEIKKETFQDLSKTIIQLDSALQLLPQSEQQEWHKTIHALIDPAQQNIKTLIMDIMKNEWNHRGKELMQLVIGVTQAAMTSAVPSLAIQVARMGTGNVATLDTNVLLITGLSGAAAFALSRYQKYLAIASENASNIVTQAIITPSVSAGNFTITIPALTPSLNYWILSQGINAASRFMEENNDALELVVKNINLREVLFGKQSTAKAAITPNSSSFIHDVVSNANIKRAIISVGGTVFKSALIGGLMYCAGFGYAEVPMIESMGCAVLTGVAQGAVAQIANIRHATEPGAVINIVSAPMGQQLLAIAGGTSQAAASAVIQAVATEVTNVILEETAQKESGLKQMLKQASSGIQSGYVSLWSSLADGWQGVKEVFTPLANSDRDTAEYTEREDY